MMFLFCGRCQSMHTDMMRRSPPLSRSPVSRGRIEPNREPVDAPDHHVGIPTESRMGRQYKVIEQIGGGAFGAALLVDSTGLDETPNDSTASASTVTGLLVVKRINARAPRSTTSSSQNQRSRIRHFLAAVNEIRALEKVRHPFIVSFYHAWVEPQGGYLHIAMEYCPAGDAYEYVKRIRKGMRTAARSGERLPAASMITDALVKRWTVQLLLALQHVHNLRIIHRDVKLQNVFLVEDPVSNQITAKLGDFGLAKTLSSNDDAAMTQAGTPYYFSPEIASGVAHSNKTDVWSLGVALYYVVAERYPFDGSNMLMTLSAIRDKLHPDLRTLVPCDGHVEESPWRPPFSVELVTLIDSMLCKDPNARPSAGELLQVPWVRALSRELLVESGPSNGDQSTSSLSSDRQSATQRPPLFPRPVSPTASQAHFKRPSEPGENFQLRKFAVSNCEGNRFLNVNVRSEPSATQFVPIVAVLSADDKIIGRFVSVFRDSASGQVRMILPDSVEGHAADGTVRERWIQVLAPCVGYCISEHKGQSLFARVPNREGARSPPRREINRAVSPTMVRTTTATSRPKPRA